MLRMYSEEVLHPKRCTARRDPNTMALDGTDAMELKGGAGLKTPVLASRMAPGDPGA